MEAKFQEAGLALMPQLRQIEDADRLAAILQAVRKADSLDAIRPLLASPPPADQVTQPTNGATTNGAS